MYDAPKSVQEPSSFRIPMLCEQIGCFRQGNWRNVHPGYLVNEAEQEFVIFHGESSQPAMFRDQVASDASYDEQYEKTRVNE